MTIRRRRNPMNLRQKLAKKLKKTGGFTLIEMLIVVAIIAILVAVSIPMVNASLDKAKRATDDANERAAKGAAIAEYLLKDDYLGTSKTYCYDAVNGKAIEKTTTTCPKTDEGADIADYGEGTTTRSDGTAVTAARKGHVEVKVNETGSGTTITWSTWDP
jgi:prepilin-type N-terminal cleavage/methylation domain-containing protein